MQLELDFSGCDEAWWCLRLYYNKYVRHLVPKDIIFESALKFGEGIHEARRVLSETSGDVDAAIDIFNRVYTTAYEDVGAEEKARTPFVGRSLIRAYASKWSTPDDLHTEIGASIEVPEAGCIYMGRIDYVANDSEYTVTDVKTTSSTFWLPFARLNWQLVGYARMVKELVGIQPQQVCIDALIVSPPAKKAVLDVNMPEHEYALRLHDSLHRRFGSIQPRDYDEWLIWLKHTASVIRNAHTNNIWPMRTPKACGRFGRSCEYEVLCKAQNADQEEKLVEALFEERKWHPYANGD